MDDRLLAGVGRFNAREFFEAHEVWERLWLDTVGNDRGVLQGLIQIAAGYHKHELGVRAGALKLLASGLQKLAASAEDACGLDLAPFRAAVGADLQRLRTGSVELQPPGLRAAS